MKNFKTLATTLFATSLLAGCAATDPYTPQSDKDFVYDNDYSFAMNVIDGSLGFHNGLRDANRPVDADTSPGAMDYLADGVIGFGGGGFGGAFLSMLGTNQGNAPLNKSFGLVYVPVKDKSKEEIEKAFAKIDSDIKDTILKHFDLKFDKILVKDSYKYFYFNGTACVQYNFAIGSKEANPNCVFAGYKEKNLLKFSSTTPDKEIGLFAVIGLTEMSTGQFFNLYSSKEYFAFYPKGFKSDIPFVIHQGKAHLFIKPKNSEDKTSITFNDLKKISPKVNSYFN
ncbi:hypothetical protein [Shewanella aestuarii]|uniref:Lipoprotein n=1 Tax=Shewanella aestuarii TaxID=1028752 RepID=A0A6G9QQK1_9GAMM|nr:hypothetical protein [Shewanella aestuarii]QIR16327.1 hypothetical protein HBH39_17735 [Shewanella aestuarii]